jgi:hypothetical protein
MAAFDPKPPFPAAIIAPFYTPSCVVDVGVMLLARLSSDAILDAAYVWLCRCVGMQGAGHGVAGRPGHF